MGLETYNIKRRFMQTPEPFGALGVTNLDALRFVVNHHAAARPHFDLRLEWGGVLLSWAVPEGPSLDTQHKRLAVRTEDHPLEYLTFEGLIPPEQYGAGELRIWDSGVWVPLGDAPEADLELGEVKFRLAGARLSGGWMLKKLPNEDKPWLLIKERDPSVVPGYKIDPAPLKPKRLTKPLKPGAALPLPTSLSPQLPTSIESPPDREGWLHEIKYDGYRTIVRKDGDQITFLTRNGHDWTSRYEALIPAFQTLDCKTVLLDGEIVAQDARGASSFELLQDALSAGRGEDLVFYAFDLVYLDGRSFTELPLLTRKSHLRRLVPEDPMNRVQFSDHISGDGRALFAQACRLGLEGVVSKDGTAPYRQERSTAWVKAKRFDVGSFAIVGFTTKASSRHIAAIMVAEDTEDGLQFAGKAGSGLSVEETRSLFEEMSERIIPTPQLDVPKTANARFIEPRQYVAEITYRGRTSKGMIRQPAILSVSSTTPATPKPRVAKLITDRDLANIRLTNPDRDMFEGSGTTKLDIALFYARVGEWMLPDLLNRPVTLVRCTTGQKEDCFYQRHGFSGLPDGVETMDDGRGTECLVIKSAKGFLGLPQFGVIEFHPWDCTVRDLAHPDRMTIDLDPGEGVDWATVVSAAQAVRQALSDCGMEGFVRMTGGAGAHVVVPLAGDADWAETKVFLKAFAHSLSNEYARLFTANMSKETRKGRLYIDINRTQFGTSAVASYSLRARDGFPAALPLSWHDLSVNAPPTDFFRKKALFHVEKGGAHPWVDFEAARSPITDQAKRAVGLKL